MNKPGASADLLYLLAAVARPPTERHAEFATAIGLSGPTNIADWRTAHTAAFVQQCPPHASFIVGANGQIGGEAADRVIDFRRMLGADAEQGTDTVSALLADYAELVHHADSDARARHARAALLWEHLLSWMTPYLDSVARSAPAPYARWACLTRDVLYLEADNMPMPQQLPLHLRLAPPATSLLDAESADGAIDMLMTPINSGVVLTRADLARAPAAPQSVSMQGSRSSVVRYLLEQDGERALAWLAGAVRDQACARARERPRLGRIAAFWSERAAATADALATMADRFGKRDLEECG